MALNKLSVTGEWPLTWYWQDGTTGAVLRKKAGTQSVPTLGMSTSFSYGTGSGQANWAYYASRTVAGTTADNLDLAGSLTDGLGNTITATALKLAVVSLAAPDGTKALRVGPRGVTNAGLFGFGDASDYQTVTHWWCLFEPVAGYSVTGGSADLFCIYNPTGSPITYSVLLAGK